MDLLNCHLLSFAVELDSLLTQLGETIYKAEFFPIITANFKAPEYWNIVQIKHNSIRNQKTIRSNNYQKISKAFIFDLLILAFFLPSFMKLLASIMKEIAKNFFFVFFFIIISIHKVEKLKTKKYILFFLYTFLLKKLQSINLMISTRQRVESYFFFTNLLHFWEGGINFSLSIS